MWLVSDECTWVGWKTKRLWNSCQVRTAQNGLLTAFYISLHHSSWTLPLISSPALTWEFNFYFFLLGLFFFPLLPPVTYLLARPPWPWPPLLAHPWPSVLALLVWPLAWLSQLQGRWSRATLAELWSLSSEASPARLGWQRSRQPLRRMLRKY